MRYYLWCTQWLERSSANNSIWQLRATFVKCSSRRFSFINYKLFAAFHTSDTSCYS
ncbi:hypothetical protein CBL_14656 [Carabus blaptoides fortunei]